MDSTSHHSYSCTLFAMYVVLYVTSSAFISVHILKKSSVEKQSLKTCMCIEIVGCWCFWGADQVLRRDDAPREEAASQVGVLFLFLVNTFFICTHFFVQFKIDCVVCR